VNTSEVKKRFAWEPITLPGVAAFAEASVWRLLFAQLVFALVVAAVSVWFLRAAWFPEISSAIEHLPVQGEIRDGKLNWPAESPRILDEGHFLAFVVDLQHEGQLRSPAHIEFEFGTNDVLIYSLFGYHRTAYPREWIIAFNRPELEPKWGAWRPPILWITFGSVVAVLFASWVSLATITFPASWLVGFFLNRKLSLGGAWKLAGASLMPGAGLLIVAISSYGLGVLDLVQLLAAYVAHFVIGWMYVLLAPVFVPKLESQAASVKNPFARA
jgi:hypothetical protein